MRTGMSHQPQKIKSTERVHNEHQNEEITSSFSFILNILTESTNEVLHETQMSFNPLSRVRAQGIFVVVVFLQNE